MQGGKAAQLRAFLAFVKSEGLVDALQERDWVRFAKRYNGADYRRNRYDTGLAAAYACFAAVHAGARGPDP